MGDYYPIGQIQHRDALREVVANYSMLSYFDAQERIQDARPAIQRSLHERDVQICTDVRKRISDALRFHVHGDKEMVERQISALGKKLPHAGGPGGRA